MKQLTRDENERFWAQNADPLYKGNTVSNVIVEIAGPYLGKKILDVGAANGALLDAVDTYSRGHAEITGIDLAPKTKRVLKGDCTQLQFESNTFDNCFMTDVIEHLSDVDLDKALSEMNRVLKPGGYSIITTINNEDLALSQVNCPQCQRSFHRWGHSQTFDEKRLASVLEAKGFEIVQVKKTNLAILAKWKVLAKIAYKLKAHNFYKTETLTNDLICIARKQV